MIRTARIRLTVGTIALAVLLVAVFGGWNGIRTWRAWQSIERIDFDPVAARQLLEIETGFTTEAPAGAPPDGGLEYDTVLAIGSDFDPNDPDRQEGIYADALLLYLAPANGDDPVLASLPRDLLVTNPCTGTTTKLNRTIEGCGDEVSGADLVALVVEDFTGVPIDHYATFDFDGFVAVVDAVDGVEICVEYALREGSLDLLPAGCSVVDGIGALRWIRSRTTQQFVGGEWRFVEGVSDVARTRRQQQLMVALLARLNEMRSPAGLAAAAEQLGGTLALDDSFSLAEAVAMVWDLRGTAGSRIRLIIVPTEPIVLDDGSFALRATIPFAELIQG